MSMMQQAGAGVPVANPLEQLTKAELREQRTSMKWQLYPRDVLPLWVAEMDAVTAEPVQRAVIDAMRRGDTGYPSPGRDYAEALAAFAEQRWGFDGLAPGRSAIVPDVMLGVVEMLQLVTQPGDPVVVNCPVYPPFYAFLGSMARRIVDAPLGPDNRLDLAVLEQTFAELTRGGGGAAYLLCSPHNPVGTVHTAEELSAVAALADRYGVRVVVDEIHAPLVLAGAEFVPYLSVPGGERGLTLMSASKGWNLAGLKAAVAFAGEAAAADLARLPEEVGHGPSHVGILAHVAALREGGPWLDALLAALEANRSLLAALLAERLPGIRWVAPEATYLAWLDCRNLGLAEEVPGEPGLVTMSTGPAAAFARQGKVALSAGQAFGTGGRGHVRLNFATSQAILTEAVRRMSTVTR